MSNGYFSYFVVLSSYFSLIWPSKGFGPNYPLFPLAAILLTEKLITVLPICTALLNPGIS